MRDNAKGARWWLSGSTLPQAITLQALYLGFFGVTYEKRG